MKQFAKVLLLTILANSAFAGHVVQNTNACDLLQQHPDWIQATKQAKQKWGVPISIQLAIIKTESHFNPNANNSSSSAYGYAQALNHTWHYYQEDVGTRAPRSSFTASADFIGWYADQMSSTLHINKADAYRLYMAYHDGAGRYKHDVRRHNPTAALAQKVQLAANNYQNQLMQCAAKYGLLARQQHPVAESA